MESSTPPAWVEFIMAHTDKRFDALDKRLDSLVSRETFRDEQARVNDILKDVQRDIAANRSDIKAEATARANAEIARADRERDETARRNQLASQTRWQWFALPAVPVVGWIVTWIMNGGLQQ